MIDLMLLEFRSLSKEEQDKHGSPSLFPDMSFKSSHPPPAGDDIDSPLGGLADELEGPEPEIPTEDSGSVASWFRGFIR